MPKVPCFITSLTSSLGSSLSPPTHSALIRRGNCLALAVAWNSYLSCNCLATRSNVSSNLLKKVSKALSLSSILMHSKASLTKFIDVKDKFPLPMLVFSPNISSNTLVLHPIVAHSYKYLLGSFLSHFSCLLNGASKFIKLGKNLLAVTLQAKQYKSKFLSVGKKLTPFFFFHI